MVMKKGIFSFIAAALFGAVTTFGAEMSRVFVEFRPGAKNEVMNGLRAGTGEVHVEFDELNALAVTLPTSAIGALQHNPNVVLVEADPLRQLCSEVVPWGVDRVQATDLWDNDDNGVLDNGAITGAGIKVGVIDTGIFRNHQDFAGVTITGEPAGWDSDGNGHGTHVCGTLAANLNGLGMVGVSPGKISLHMVKVFDAGGTWVYASTLLDAVRHAQAAGCKVISMSLGGPQPSSVEERGFNNLYKKGLLLVAGAGNAGDNSVLYPAGYGSVISVAATDMNNNVGSFSQKNSDVELAAPGVDIYSTIPGPNNTSAWAYWSGTSFSTPHVSGVAALIWSKYPSKSNQAVRAALQAGALDLGSPGRDASYGYGLVQAKNSLNALATIK
jgi:subtilisin family serine protease